MLKPEIQILLSTYNGEAYLKAQIESILSQTYKNWQVLIRDDGSTDGTRKIIEHYCTTNANQFIELHGGKGGSSTQSFLTLLNQSDAPYLMFCDQDDIWESNKIEMCLARIKEIEKSNPAALVFTDMKVVDQNLGVLFESFMQHQKLNPTWTKNRYFVYAQSMAAGCTMIFTSLLKEKMKPIELSLFQHDHWLLINATHFGKIGFMKNKTVLYRQHLQNSIGSHQLNSSYFYNKKSSLKQVFKRWKHINSQFPETNMLFILTSKIRLNIYRFLKSF